MSWPTTHGMTHSPEYRSWENMVQRCTNPNAPNWPRYGGAGVTIHPDMRSFEKFFAELGPRPTARCSVDRIDPARGYEPGNVRWACASTQELNKLLPQRWPGTTLDRRRGTYSWQYQRAGTIVRGSGYATAEAAFRAKMAAMSSAGIRPSRSDQAAAEAGASMYQKEHIH